MQSTVGKNRVLFDKKSEVLPKYGIDHHKQNTDGIRGDVEVFFCLEHTGSQRNTLDVILVFAGAEAYHHNDGHGEEAGVEHLVNEGHINR